MSIGAVELCIALAIAMRRWSPKACAIGSAGAVMMFLTTLSFLVSTPRRLDGSPPLGGFPALPGSVGELLIKDVVLLGVAIWSLGEAWSASETKRAHRGLRASRA